MPTKDLFNLVKVVGKIVDRTIIVCQGGAEREVSRLGKEGVSAHWVTLG